MPKSGGEIPTNRSKGRYHRGEHCKTNLSQQQWIAEVHHHREANHLGRAIEITERIAHRRKLLNDTARLRPI